MFGFGVIFIISGFCMLAAAVYNSKIKKRFIISLVSTIILFCVGTPLIVVSLGSQSFQRWLKNTQSNYSGGLDRTITIINQNGEITKQYEGRMDIVDSDIGLTFIMDGKKYVIHKSVLDTIIVEEK